MKNLKISKILIVLGIITLPFYILTISTSEVGSGKIESNIGEKSKSNPVLIENSVIENLIEDIDLLKQKIGESSIDCWRKPKSMEKSNIITKLQEVQLKIGIENYEEAYNKTLHDIKPKLTGLKTDEEEEPWGNGVFKKPWVVCNDLKEELRLDCNNILFQIRSLSEPVQDITPPTITISPPDVTINDEEAIGGFSVQWEIYDESGVGSASVSLNGDIIVNYGSVDIIIDSCVLTNSLGDNLLQITAVDTNGLESSAQTMISVIDDDTTSPNIAINYVGSGTDFDPGWWTVILEDIESELAEVTILVNGYEIEHEVDIGGQISYEIDCPATVNTHTIEVIAINNDNDREGDQESSTETDSVTIIPDPIFGIPF